jgi:hypothetical protein
VYTDMHKPFFTHLSLLQVTALLSKHMFTRCFMYTQFLLLEVKLQVAKL